MAVITGARGGIGEELAKYWIGQGGKVVLADISADGLSRVEVPSWIGKLFRHQAIAADTFFIHGGPRLGSKG